MTELLFPTDAYLKEFDAEVLDVLPEGVLLSRTAFYPGGGGQPHDRGTIEWVDGAANVVSVRKMGDHIVHGIDGPAPPRGAQVRGILDWDRRYSLMRTHTALHILCAVVYRDFGTWVTGSNMEPLKARMDFELDTITAAFSSDIEERINIEVAAARTTAVRILPREEAFKIPDLIRTKINLLPKDIEEVRTVSIQGLDLQADGGTHVSNTREVGHIHVVGHQSKGKINKRLRIALDP